MHAIPPALIDRRTGEETDEKVGRAALDRQKPQLPTWLRVSIGRMKTLLVAALLLSPALASPALAHAQAQTKMPIYIECDAKSDEVGKGLCSSLRDAIARSPRYALVASPDKEFHFVIFVASLPIDGGSASAASVVFGVVLVGVEELHYLGHTVTITGSEKVGSAADKILENLDDTIAGLLQPSKP
jgi:hypothetical protein